MSDKYILDGKTPVPEPDLFKWALWLGDPNCKRIVKVTELPNGVTVSSVFLGLDHSYGEGPPLLFETMIFGGKHDREQFRCSTWEQAEAQHQEAIELIFA